MNINCNTYSLSQYNQQQKHTSFTSNNGAKTSGFRNPMKKLMPYIFGGMLMGGLASCDNASDQRFTEMNSANGVTVEYTDVHKETKDSIMKPFFELKSKLNQNNDFLEGINVYVAKSACDLTPSNSFKDITRRKAPGNLKGRSFYSDALLPKTIFIQENAHEKYAGYDRKTKKTTIVPALRQTLMHESGHQFDNYFGHDHNAKFALQYDSLMNEKEMSMYENPYDFNVKNDKEWELLTKYTNESGLSDKKEFKQAVLEDINKLRNIPEGSALLPENLKYYIQDFDISRPITSKDVELADYSRGEIYANLFSYALGEDEGEKKAFTKTFSESYKVVKSDVRKYLRIIK